VLDRDQVRRDLAALCVDVPHRCAYTGNERKAAEYIDERFRAHTADVAIEDFSGPDNQFYLFAAYYVEFLFVAIIALWFPWVAFAYGLCVFLLYLAEFSGFRTLSSLFPSFQSQNVVARFLAEHPRRLVVVLAHCDSPRVQPLRNPRHAGAVRWGHVVVVGSMVLVLVACGARALDVFHGGGTRLDVLFAWIGGGILLVAALFLAHCETVGESTPGAIDNASGVAALLALAARISGDMPKHTDVWLVATGAHSAWMNGARNLVATHRLHRADTVFINLEGVGSRRIDLITGEGLLHAFHSHGEFARHAAAVAAEQGIPSRVHRGMPTDALIPLVRGYPACTLMGDLGDLAEAWPRDAVVDVETEGIVKSVDATLALLRKLDSD
jgi:peptidase M28-like protein